MYRIAIDRPGQSTEHRTANTAGDLCAVVYDLMRSEGDTITDDPDLIELARKARFRADTAGSATLKFRATTVTIRPAGRPSYDMHERAIDRLREAVRTIPTGKEGWYLIDAMKIMLGARDHQSVPGAYDRRPLNRDGLHSWDFTIKQLDALVTEGWLAKTNGYYLPTDAAKNTWPPQAA
jgi:hypothetical protein